MFSGMWHTQDMALAAAPELRDRSALLHTYKAPSNSGNYAAGWDNARIRAGRDAQIAGNFREAVALAEVMKCDAAIFAALLNRVAPHRGLARAVYCTDDQLTEEVVYTFRRDGAALPSSTIADGHERVAMNGLWIGQNVWKARPDGSRLDVRLETWPLSQAYWSKYTSQLIAQTTEGPKVVTHGDGKWVVAALHGDEPWQWGAVKPLATTFSDRQFGLRDRSQHSEAHGLGHWIAELPEGMPLDHPDAAKVNLFLQALWTSRSGGTLPHGTNLKLLEAMAGGWQIFRELIKDETSDALRVLLGQDGSVVNEGGNYIKAAQLFGVRQDLIEGDLGCFAPAITTGTMVPWSLVNLGEDVGLSTAWLFPDPDEDLRRKALAERVDAYNRSIAAYKGNGFIVDQDFADRLAADYGVPVPVLAAAPTAPPAAPAAAPPGE